MIANILYWLIIGLMYTLLTFISIFLIAGIFWTEKIANWFKKHECYSPPWFLD